jgi:hypothetical protein
VRGANPNWSDQRVYDQDGTRNTQVVLTPTGIQELEGLEWKKRHTNLKCELYWEGERKGENV